MSRFNTPLVRTAGIFLVWLLSTSTLVAQQDWKPIPARDVLLEFYYRAEVAADQDLLAAAQDFAGKRPGLRLVARDLSNNPKNEERLEKVLEHYQLPTATRPAIYGCNQVIYELEAPEKLEQQLRSLLRYDVYTRDGCHRCDEAKELLPEFLKQYPAFELRFLNISKSPESLTELNRLVEKHHQAAASTPAMHICNQLLIGFDRTNATPERLHKTLGRWTVAAKTEQPKQVSEVTGQRPFSLGYTVLLDAARPARGLGRASH